MSQTASPISAARFRAALIDLPLSSIHEKAAEIRNSKKHLRESNVQLRQFAEAGDRDCAEAIAENETVLERMEERLILLRDEVEHRGMPWIEDSVVDLNGVSADDTAENSMERLPEQSAAQNLGLARNQSGRYTDEELARRLAEQVDEDRAEEDGVHL